MPDEDKALAPREQAALVCPRHGKRRAAQPGDRDGAIKCTEGGCNQHLVVQSERRVRD